VDELALIILQAILNGAMLAVGMILGTRLTASTMERKIMKMIEKSETAQAFKKLLLRIDEMLRNQEVTSKAEKFFEEATVLVTSPEAKNFFKNLTELMKMLGTSEGEEILKLPKKEVKE